MGVKRDVMRTKSVKNLCFETLLSSGRTRHLSNFSPLILNNCLRFARSLLPQSCQLCGVDNPIGPLCPPCLEDLPWLSPDGCTICATPLTNGTVCGACLDRPPRFDRVEAVFAYRFPVDALVHAYKYGGKLALARVLGELLTRRVTCDVDAIVPMPLAHGRLAERGFNQALEIARVVAAGTG